nr:IS1595 family transposase [Spiroplasma ixodetis]
MINVLIENGANINHANQNGDTALHLATKNGLAQIVNTLLINNAHIHFINQNGDTALTIIINNSLFYDKNIKNTLENIFYQEYEEYITNKAKVEIIKYRPEFSNNSLFHDIKDNILIHLNTNNSVKNIKENLILIGLKIDKKRILKIEQKIKKIFKCNINKLTGFSPHVLVEETMKLNEFNNAFQTEQDCLKYIASLKKNKCIMCSWTSLNTSNLRRIRCLKCHQTFSILHGTIFYKSQTPLRFWFYLIFRWINTKHGITSTDVAKELGVTLKTAWKMGHEIRNRIAKQEHQFIVEGIVQMDVMYLSHMGFKKQGRSLINKTLIVGIYEKTTNNLIVKVIKNAKSKNLLQFARNHISSKCDVHTDSWKGYRDFKSLFPNHKTVNHQNGYVSKIGVNTNQIESVWKHIRRTFKTHIKVAKHHVHLYAKEAAYKFNKMPTFETVMLCFI